MHAQASIRDLAKAIEPDLDVLSVSNPQPTLRSYNAVGVFASRDDARNAVLGVESLEPHETAVGMTTLGSSAHSEAVTASGTDAAGEPFGVDPEGVMSDIGPRALKGAVIFAVVGAVLAGAITALFGDRDLIVVAAMTAAVFGAVVGALWAAFIRMGLSDAYLESFVNPDSFDKILVSYHTDDRSVAEEAARRFALAAGHDSIVVRLDDITGSSFAR